MEIHQTGATGVTVRCAEGVVGINPIEKIKKALVPNVILHTYAVPVAGWSETFEAEEGQKVFLGAGEYEKNTLHIQGFSAETETLGQTVQTTTWYLEGDGVKVLVLGDNKNKEDLKNTVADVGVADILVPLCPETKEKRISAADIVSIAAALEAKRIIPIGDNESMKKKIAKEAGDMEEVTGKYTIKKRDLGEDRVKVIILE